MQAATDSGRSFQWEMATGERPAPIWKAEPPESQIRFALKHRLPVAMIGEATRWKAFAALDFEEPARSWVDVVVDATSLETGDRERDSLIRSPEILDARAFPEILFNSTEVTAFGEGGRWQITGDLTIRHVTLPATMDLEIDAGARGPNAVAVTGRMAIDRRHFALRWEREPCPHRLGVGTAIELTILIVARRGNSH